jgi:hypothetical protein
VSIVNASNLAVLNPTLYTYTGWYRAYHDSTGVKTSFPHPRTLTRLLSRLKEHREVWKVTLYLRCGIRKFRTYLLFSSAKKMRRWSIFLRSILGYSWAPFRRFASASRLNHVFQPDGRTEFLHWRCIQDANQAPFFAARR